MKEIALSNSDNQGHEVSITQISPAQPDSEAVQYTEITDEKSMIPNKSGQYAPILTNLSFILPPGSCTLQGPYQHLGGGGSTSINKCNKVLAKSALLPVDRLDTVGICNGIFQMTSQPFASQPCSCQFKITNSGQESEKVIGN